MKRLLTLVAFFATLQASAQQVNPVPDYVFRNQMSVGRGTVTDTAAYFSIGPRYGATKGFMPPIVGDTATFSSGKRNGLLIFSVQKNKFLYWDSVRVQWSDMAGGSGSYILAGDTSAMLAPYLRKVDTTSMLTAYLRKGDTTAMLSPYYRSATASAALALKLNISDTSSMLANYIRHAGYGLTKSGQSFLVDTLNIATRAWRQKGLDSLAALEVSGSGTTNYVAKFTAGSTIGNSQIFDNGTSIGIGTTSPDIYSGGSYKYLTVSNTTANGYTFLTLAGGAGGGGQIDFGSQNTRHAAIASFSNSGLGFYSNGTNSGTGVSERMRLTSSGELLINTTTDAGDYKLQISGNLYTSNGAYFGVIGDNVGVGTATPETKFHVKSSNALEWIETTTSNRSILALQALDTDVRILSTYNTGGSNFVPITFWTSGAEKMRLSIDGEFLVNTTSDAGDYKLQVSGNIYNTGSITTGAPSGGSIKPWKIGEAATVSPTSPNRTIRVEIDGTVYYLHAKTTND